MSKLAEVLLEAHVQHELSRLQSAALSAQIAAWVQRLFRWFAEVKLDQVATVAQIMGVIDRYVIELRVSGGITELAGEVTQLVFTSASSAQTRLDQILDDDTYETFAQKIAELEGLRRELIALIARSEASELLSARLILRSVRDLLLGSPLTSKLTQRLSPKLEQRVADALSRQLAKQRKRAVEQREQRLLEALDPDCLRSVADEVWSHVSSMPLAEAFRLLNRQDLEDFVVLGHEFWLRYRKTAYFRGITAEVVEHVFRKYGQQTLGFLIEDMGVNEHMVTRELTIFLGPLFAEAERTGFMEQEIRTRLEPFYRSRAVAELLERS